MPAAEEKVSHLIDADLTAIRAAAVKFSTSPDVWMAVAGYIYRKITARPPLSDEDYSRYSKMRTHYLSCTQPTATADHVAIPREWVLEEDRRPQYYSKFATQQDALLAELERFDRSNHALKLQISAIVTTIAELYRSIGKRLDVPYIDLPMFRERYRPDGFESMFLTELAMWAVIDLPRHPITDEKTAQMVMRRIEYCEAMQREVLVFRGDTALANPLNISSTVIKELKALHANLLQAQQTASFTTRVMAIDNELLTMTSHSFNILYLMVQGVRLKEFNVFEFLEPSEGRAKKMASLKKHLLAEWIAITAEAVGLEANDFKNHKDVPIAMLDSHLPDIRIPDADAIATLGFHEFVWRKNYSLLKYPGTSHAEAAHFVTSDGPVLLKKIRELHRAILRLYSIRHMLTLASQLNVAYGDTWLFCTDEGQLILNALLDSLTDATAQYRAVLTILWKDYYVERYEPFALAQHKDSRDETYLFMVRADGLVKKAEGCITTIDRAMSDIRAYGRQAIRETKEHAQRKKLLSQSLYDYLSRIAGYDSTVLSHLRSVAALSAESVSVKILTSSEDISPEHAIERAKRAALLELCEHTGQKPSQIKAEWIEASYAFFLLSPTSPIPEVEQAEIRARHNAVLAEAKEFYSSHTGDTSMPKEHSQSNAVVEAATFSKEDMKVALWIQEFMETKEKSDLVFRSLPEGHIVAKLPRGVCRDIYEKVLKPYALIAENSVVATLSFYSKKQHELLRKHFTLMVKVLCEIADNFKATGRDEKIAAYELAVINNYLMRGLLAMYIDMPWIDNASRTHSRHTTVDKTLLMRVKEDRVEILSSEVRIGVLLDERKKDNKTIETLTSEREQLQATLAETRAAAAAATEKAVAATTQAVAATAQAAAATAKAAAAEEKYLDIAARLLKLEQERAPKPTAGVGKGSSEPHSGPGFFAGSTAEPAAAGCGATTRPAFR